MKCRNLAFGIGEEFRKMITPLRLAIHNKQKFYSQVSNKRVGLNRQVG